MTNVTFEEDRIAAGRRPQKSGRGIPGWIVSHSGGMIKNESQASVVLVIFVIVALFASYKVLTSQSGTKASLVAPPGYEVVTPQNGPPRLAPVR